MGQFAYKAKNKEGKNVAGVMDGSDKNEIYVKLRKEGLAPIFIKPQNKSLLSSILPYRLKARDLILLCQNMSTLLNSGITLAEAFKIIAEQTQDKKLKGILDEIVKDIGGGLTTAQAMEKTKVFPKLSISLVRVGEETGQLENSFDQLANYYLRQKEIEGKIRSALIYPIIITVVSIVVVYILTTHVLPEILSFVRDAGVTLGFTTKALIWISDFLQEHGTMVVMGFIASIAGFIHARKTVLKSQIDGLVYKIPVFGTLIKRSIASNFAATLATLIVAGVRTPIALEIIKDLIDNTLAKQNIGEVKEGVIKGETISENMSITLFDPMAINIIAIGEKSGDMEEPLKAVSNYLDREVNEAVDRVTEMIMPIAMIVLGGIIGVIVMGTMGPMLQLYGEGF